MVYLGGEGTVTLSPCSTPTRSVTVTPQRHQGCHVPRRVPQTLAHLRAFRSPSVLVEGWSFKTLMQPFIWRGSERGSEHPDLPQGSIPFLPILLLTAW